MIPMHVFRVRTFSAANALTLLLYGGLYVFTFFFPLNMIEIQGYTPSVTGLAFLPFALMLVLLSSVSGYLSDRFGPRPLLMLGTALGGFGFLWLSSIGINEKVSDLWTTFVPGLVMFGGGMAMIVAPLTAAVMTALPDQLTGVASGINNAVSRGAGALGIAIMGALGLALFGAELATAVGQTDPTDNQIR